MAIPETGKSGLAGTRILTFPQDAVPARFRSQVIALRDLVWPRSDSERPPGHDLALDPLWLLLIDEQEAVAAALAILSKPITHLSQRYSASGLSAVVTDPRRRGRGYGHRLVTVARELIAESGRDLGIFTCDQPLANFYVRAGWRLLPGTVLVGGTPEAPFPSDQLDKVTLGEFFTHHARTHAADFEGARIELYPGELDRLW